MMSRNTFRAWSLSLVAVSALQGCATFKCGVGGCPGDAKITAEVRSLFKQEPSLEAPSLIGIRTLDRVVYLNGLVQTPYQVLLAGATAEKAEGVARVVNLVAVDNSK